jgi:hypothetical protein
MFPAAAPVIQSIGKPAADSRNHTSELAPKEAHEAKMQTTDGASLGEGKSVEKMKKLQIQKNESPNSALGSTSVTSAMSEANTKDALTKAPTAVAQATVAGAIAVPAPIAASPQPVLAAAPPQAFPAAPAPTASEQLLALINDERGACKPAPSLAAVRRLLAQGANPSFDKLPLGDHGTITRRAQLCGFGDVVQLLEK